ncbi:MAG TPA: PASTA domain-containing protein [Longimicrobiales bacterium]|nr:PASTA domain-containing protein [Longimicrobiales bacterium]
MTRMGDSIRRRRGRGGASRGDAAAGTGGAPWSGRGSSRRPMRWSRWIPGGLLAIALAFGLGWLIAVTVLFPKPALARDEVAVPDLSGLTLDEAAAELAPMRLRPGDIRELVHPTAPDGEVVAQDPLPGQWLRPGAAVRLALSQGRARVTVPDLAGMPAEAAIALAQRIGFETLREDEPTLEAAGRVLRTRPAAGTQAELPADLIVVVSGGGLAPPVDTAPADPIGWESLGREQE